MKILFAVLLTIIFIPTISPAVDSVSAEKRILEQKQRNALDACRKSGQKYKQRKSCVDSTNRSYRNKIASLRADPAGYFAKKRYNLEMEPYRREIRNAVRKEMNSRGYTY